MKDINNFINENAFTDVIITNIKNISDEQITTEVSEYAGFSLSQVDILNTWHELLSKIGNRASAWMVDAVGDVDRYNSACKKWVDATIKKYNITKCPHLKEIMLGIAWTVNTL